MDLSLACIIRIDWIVTESTNVMLRILHINLKPESFFAQIPPCL